MGFGVEGGFTGRLYSLSGNGDSSGRGRKSLNAVATVLTAASSQLIGDNQLRLWLLLCNMDAAHAVYLALGNDLAISGQGIVIPSGGGWCLFNKEMPWTGAIQAIADTANTNLVVCEVSLQTTTPEPTPTPGNGGTPTPVKFGVC